MTDQTEPARLRDVYGPGFTPDQYRQALAAGYETGWWNEHGHPAPWPEELHQWPSAPDPTKINKEADTPTNTPEIEPPF